MEIPQDKIGYEDDKYDSIHSDQKLMNILNTASPTKFSDGLKLPQIP